MTGCVDTRTSPHPCTTQNGFASGTGPTWQLGDLEQGGSSDEGSGRPPSQPPGAPECRGRGFVTSVAVQFDVEADVRAFTRVFEAWKRLTDEAISHQAADRRLLAEMLQAESVLRSEGRWTSGPTTMLEVLRQEQNEVRNCRVLSWILDPLGPHCLGADALSALLNTITVAAAAQGVSVPAFDLPHQASVHVEEQRDHTRADLIIEGASWSVVIEAKINAREQHRQGERLSELWPGATYVFLTRRGAAMSTAGEEAWIRLSWADVLAAIRVALEGAEPPPAGTDVERARRAVEDYLHGARRLAR